MCNQHYSESSSRLAHSIFTSTDEQELLLNLFVGALRGEVTCLHQLSQLVLTQLVWFQCVQPESLHHSAALLLVTILERQDRCLSRLGAKMCQSRSSTGEWEPRKDWLRNQNSQLPVKKLLDRGSQAPACVQSLLDLGKVNTKVPGTCDFSAYVWGCPILEGGKWEETTDIENARTQHFCAEELHQLLCWPISESLNLKWFSWSVTEVKEDKESLFMEYLTCIFSPNPPNDSLKWEGSGQWSPIVTECLSPALDSVRSKAGEFSESSTSSF